MSDTADYYNLIYIEQYNQKAKFLYYFLRKNLLIPLMIFIFTQNDYLAYLIIAMLLLNIYKFPLKKNEIKDTFVYTLIIRINNWFFKYVIC